MIPDTAELLRQRYNERVHNGDDIGRVMTETVGDLIGAVGALTEIVGHLREVVLLLADGRSAEAKQVIDTFSEERRR